MKVLMLNGSPRKNGNTAIALNEVKGVLEQEGIEVEIIQVGNMDITGCKGCLYCKEKGIGAYQGGTCNETDRSAQVCVNCAMATKPVQILAKPGMGVDEGFMIVYNEMNRILALRSAKK